MSSLKTLNDWPSLADGCAAFEKQIVTAGCCEQRFEDCCYPPILFNCAVFNILACRSGLNSRNAFRYIEFLPKSHFLMVLSILTNILRIQEGITARSCSIVSGSGCRRMMSCMRIKSSSEKFSSPIDFSA